jgi:ribosomal-protein-alanine N-acetyltransferase
MKPVAHTRLAVKIRWLIRRDMDEVLDIERDSFDAPWRERDFVLTLKCRNVIAMVAEHHEQVVGFMVYELHKSRLHALRLAVAAGARRRQVGTQLVEKLTGKLSCQRRTRLVVDLCETNVRGQLFLRSCGLACVQTIPRGFESGEDRYVFEYRLPVPAAAAC